MEQHHIFKNYSPKESVGENFENEVFQKIERKKINRKRTSYTVSFGVFVFMVFLLFQVFTANQSTSSSFKADHFDVPPKEEIPVIEDVYFVSSDSRTSYALERVSKEEFDHEI
jgi:hypothetical protein